MDAGEYADTVSTATPESAAKAVIIVVDFMAVNGVIRYVRGYMIKFLDLVSHCAL